jgi:hypothetical protein
MTSEISPRMVVYLHHTRLDGEVVIFFRDPDRAGEEPLCSSPVRELKRRHSAAVDLTGHGDLARYLIFTENSIYEVQMPRDRADHLACELGLDLSRCEVI